MAIDIVARVANRLGLPVEEVVKEALKLFLCEELRRVRAEKAMILSRYGVKSFEELMKLIEDGRVSDVDAHDDIARLDYLEHREKMLSELLNEIEGSLREPSRRTIP